MERSSGLHTKYWRRYHDRYDKHGTVTEGTVAAQVQQEIAQHGGILVSASTMMEAYWKYYFIVEDYNAKVDAWNAYAPSQAKNKRWTTVPSKKQFSKFSCFGSCGYQHDLLEYARDTHKVDCGTAENIEAVAQRAVFAAAYGSNRAIAAYVEATVRSELQSRDVDDGCGRPYWACDLDDREAHEKQPCSTSGCSYQYRNCFPHKIDHSNHGGTPSTTTTSPTITTPTTSASTLSYHACGVHEDWQSGDHSAAGCGTSGHYVCDGSDHSYTYCYVTDSNGNTCTVGSYYCLLYTSPSPRDRTRSRMPSSA